MSWSLRLHHGDFALFGSQFSTVTNEEKLTQDLRCALLERMGTDPAHPEYGSIIDGGRQPDGIEVASVIAQPVRYIAATVESEIQRVAAYYKNQQLNRARSDRLIYNRVSLTPNEVLLAITDIRMEQAQNVLNVTVVFETANGQDITIALPLTPNS